MANGLSTKWLIEMDGVAGIAETVEGIRKGTGNTVQKTEPITGFITRYVTRRQFDDITITFREEGPLAALLWDYWQAGRKSGVHFQQLDSNNLPIDIVNILNCEIKDINTTGKNLEADERTKIIVVLIPGTYL